ncbi:MAG: branched chain amino acid aminotransferase [Bacteroidetes bacterium RBG_13_42_15]|nr:MAG: branched chain amino acid aminotransferase [Bacteroidetes bacterium RBG_13_42_15]
MDTIDWKHLPFAYMKTDYNARCYFRDGKWGELEISSSEYIHMHIAATSLHYGQEAFEGLKAFRGKDGRVRIFRWRENAKRMHDTAIGIKMAPVPEALFGQAVLTAIRLNERFIPPYGQGASLYIRPLLIGTGAEVGVKPAKEYLFIVFVTPVGPYFKEGFKPVDVMICRSHDRAAPLGTGCYKVGGNYAAGLTSGDLAHQQGYSAALYLDAKEKKYIDEAGPANFFGIRKNSYITPESRSILPSITNKSLMALAANMGMTIEKRPVPVEELRSFEEAGACGTAAVITPIRKIIDPDLNTFYEYCRDGNPGPVSTALYNNLTAIQNGDSEDPFNWVDYLD